jgi:hypothetical protein
MSAMMNQTESQTGIRIIKKAPDLPVFPFYFSLYLFTGALQPLGQCLKDF